LRLQQEDGKLFRWKRVFCVASGVLASVCFTFLHSDTYCFIIFLPLFFVYPMLSCLGSLRIITFGTNRSDIEERGDTT